MRKILYPAVVLLMLLAVCIPVAFAAAYTEPEVNNFADDQLAADTTAAETTALVALSKVGTPIENHPGEYEVVLKVTGAEKEEEAQPMKADIILLLDVTGSLGSTGLSNVKQAAFDFMDIIFSDADTDSRVSIITFTDYKNRETNQCGIQNKYATSGSYFYTYSTYQANKNKSDFLPIITYSTKVLGATNMQYGFSLAEQVLDSAECKDRVPFVVFMTDGAPNRAMKIVKKDSGSYTIRYKINTSSSEYNSSLGWKYYSGRLDYGDTIYSGSNSGGDDAAYYTRYPTEKVSVYDTLEGDLVFSTDKEIDSWAGDTPIATDVTIEWCCMNDIPATTYKRYPGGSTIYIANNPTIDAIGVCQQTLYCANKLRSRPGLSLFTVGVGKKIVNSKTETQTEKFLKKIVTGEGVYTPISDTSAIVEKFKGIATTIKNIVTGAKVVDPMGADVGLMYEDDVAPYSNKKTEYTSGTANVYVSTGTLTYDKATDTITWDIGDIPYGVTYEMIYRVKFDNGVAGEGIPLNAGASVTYTDQNGEEGGQKFEDPKGELLIAAKYKVKHMLENVADKNYTEKEEESFDSYIGRTTEAVAKTYTGFTAQTFSQTKVTSDDTDTVYIYYTRNVHNVSYGYSGTVPTNAPNPPTTASKKYDSSVTVENKPTMKGYTLSDWTSSDVTISSGKFTMPDKDVALSGTWTANNDVSYTVKYLEQGTNVVLANEKEVKNQTFDSTVTENAVTVTHFTPTESSQQVKLDDYDKVITFYYTCDTQRIFYIVENDDPDADKTEYIDKGEDITPYAPTQEKFDFDGWYTDAGYTTKWTPPAKMGDSDITVYGKFVAQDAYITIKKSGMQENENAVFVITGEGLGSGVRVVVNGKDGALKISGLRVGKTYTVTEDTNWSWKYTCGSLNNAQQVTVSESLKNYDVIFTNTPKKVNWYSGETSKKNIFEKKAKS